MMESELLGRLWSSLGIAICGVVLFFLGRAYEASKNKGARAELKRLRLQTGLLKRLTPKLKWGEDVRFKRPKRLAPVRQEGYPVEDETVTQGHPNDA